MQGQEHWKRGNQLVMLASAESFSEDQRDSSSFAVSLQEVRVGLTGAFPAMGSLNTRHLQQRMDWRNRGEWKRFSSVITAEQKQLS
jgi:hypothetical protein